MRNNARRWQVLSIAVGIILMGQLAIASSLTISLAPAVSNPGSPEMGDHLSFHSVIANNSGVPLDGMTAWVSLIQVDAGKEQPVDLEDWSAHKAVTVANLQPGAQIFTQWPMRLIQAGHYRVVVSAADRSGSTLTSSPFSDFEVARKPVVESSRVLPVAFGVPLLLLAAMVWRWRARRS